MRSTAGRAGAWTSRSVLGGSPSRRRPSSSRFRCPTSISTPSPPTTSCARGACRSESAITRVGCALGRPRSPTHEAHPDAYWGEFDDGEIVLPWDPAWIKRNPQMLHQLCQKPEFLQEVYDTSRD